MNSYNDNLHSNVVASLQAQQTELKTTKANLNAATYSLFYAEGAKITAQQKLDDDTVVYQFQQQVKEQAVLNNNMAVNVNGTAQDQKAHTALSVTNTSVGASNVQIAANAILRLASNVGSIYSIVSAANYDTEIYLQSKEANRLMGITAYEAERTSQLAMEVASLTAEVSSSTVADMASSTQKSVANMLSVALTDFNTIATTIAADNASLSSANDAEKKAEGEVEYRNTDFFAAQSAFVINNRELNLNLNVTKNNEDDSFFNVAFDFYKSPFKLGKDEITTEGDSTDENVPGYPVKSYYIMVVKDSNKSIFSMSNAEALLLNPTQFIQVNPAPARLAQRFINETIASSDLNDSDGDSIKFGTKYVVFVLATFLEEYKKLISNFDDYLTAASNTFVLTNVLASPKPIDIKLSKEPATLDFQLIENAEYEVEYRCILLPHNADEISGLLTANGLRDLENEVEEMDKIADKYVPQITKLRADSNSYIAQLEAIQNEQKSLRKAERLPGNDKVKSKKDYEANATKQNEINAKLTLVKKTLTELEREQEVAARNLLKYVAASPGFFFNRDIAEHISFANYTVATPLLSTTKGKETPKDKKQDEAPVVNESTRHLSVKFIADTNDVFGNKLDSTVQYIPAILSISTALVENQVQFTNSLSDFEKTKPISIIFPQ